MVDLILTIPDRSFRQTPLDKAQRIRKQDKNAGN
jgi:hypothetical protein